MNQIKDKFVLDITDQVCPMIFVKTKIFLEQCPEDVDKKIIVKGRDNLESLSKTLTEQNHEITIQKQKKHYFLIIIKASKV